MIWNTFDCLLQGSIADDSGRFLILKVLLNGEQALLVNVYGPSQERRTIMEKI